jgi:HSP20 family protein
MALVPWDPFKNLATLQERMNRLFDESLQKGQDAELFTSGTWMPAVDIYETEDEITLVAELPGMDHGDVDIQVRDNSLTLKGERKMEKPVKEETYHRVERAHGSFSRSFTLPTSVDQEKITASFGKGLLEIKMPKSPKARAQQIKIEVKE